MQKVFIGVVTCVLLSLQVQAQHEQARQTLKSIRKDVDNLLKYGKLDTACNLVLAQFKGNLPPAGDSDLEKSSIEKLTAGSASFLTATAATAFRQRCNYKLITQFIDSVRKLDIQLKALRETPAVTGTKPDDKNHGKIIPGSLRVVIQVLDKEIGSPVNAELKIDSLENTATGGLQKARDSAGYYYLFLVPGKQYTLAVTATGYKIHKQDLTAREDQPSRTETIRLEPESGAVRLAAANPAEQLMLKSYVDSLFKKFTILFVLVSIVSIVLSAVNFLYAYSFYKWHRASMSNPPDPGLTSSGYIQQPESTPDTTPSPETVPQPLAVSLAEDPGKESFQPVPAPVASPASAYFLSEILITAGPRKKSMSDPESDKDLGEDVCGFVSNGNELLLWLLDGTSDLHCLKNPEDKREYFSSRLLAQGIANKLRASFLSKNGKPLEEILLEAIQEVRQGWLLALDKLPVAEKEILRSNIEKKNIPECATTLLIGQLSINGDITAYRSGDSKMLLFGGTDENEIAFRDTSLADKNDEANDRVFFRLVLSPEGSFDILCNVPKYEIVQERNINTLIVFSDGIGGETETLIKKQYAAGADWVREEIIYQAQGTADDKSICFVQIKR